MAGSGKVEMMLAKEPDLKKQKLEVVNLKDSSESGEEKEKSIVSSSSSNSEELEQHKSLPLPLVQDDCEEDDGEEEEEDDGEEEEEDDGEEEEEDDGWYMVISDSDEYDDEWRKTCAHSIYKPPVDMASESVIDRLTKLTEVALEKYNEDNWSKYVFVSVVKAKVEYAAGGTYYITFKAKLPDEGDDNAKTFQTIIFKGLYWQGSLRLRLSS